jgi:hypothetical protein
MFNGAMRRQPDNSRLQRLADQLERDLIRALGMSLREQCEDAGITRAMLARAAHLSEAQVGRILAGTHAPSIHAIAALAVALNGRPIVRIEPISGPPIRDRFQTPILESLLRIVHSRWKRFTEVMVHRPVRGFIDLVLHEPDESVVVATEIHSQVRRFEQLQRWANSEARSVIGGSDLPLVAASAREPRVSQLLVLRSTATNRALVNALTETIRTTYPARTAELYRALTTADSEWPGAGLLWASIDKSTVRILPTPPRGVTVGR